MTREQFAAIVAATIAELPPQFARHVSSMTVDIEDAPSRATLRSLGLDPRTETIFGLYEGTPLGDRDLAIAPLPDRIVLYFRPLVESFRSPPRLKAEIRLTLLHEIGHALGLEDDDEGMDC